MILSIALNLLGKELQGFLSNQLSAFTSGIPVLVDKVEKNDTNSQEEGIIISLIRIEEERTLSNFPGRRQEQITGQFVMHKPDLYLNLYILVSTNFQDYDNALIALSYALEFYQAKSVFNSLNLQDPSLLDDLSNQQKAEFSLAVELHSLSYEQTNYLWSTFGGEQSPHFVLKARLVQVITQQPFIQGPAIQQVQSKEIIN